MFACACAQGLIVSAGWVAGNRLWTTWPATRLASAAVGEASGWSAEHDPLRGWVDDDLADRLAGEERVDIDLTAADLAEAEWTRSGWRERLAADVGRTLLVRLAATSLRAELVELLADGLLLRQGGGREPDVLVSWHAVVALARVDPAAVSGARPRRAQRPRSSGAVLRQWAAARGEVSVVTLDGRLERGLLGIVTSDTVDLHASGDTLNSLRVLTVSRAALAVVELVGP